MHTQSVTTRRRCGRKGKHEAPCELSAHTGIGIAADQVESKVSRIARGVGSGVGGWVGGGGRSGGGGAVVHGIAQKGREAGGRLGASHGQGRVRGFDEGRRGN